MHMSQNNQKYSPILYLWKYCFIACFILLGSASRIHASCDAAQARQFLNDLDDKNMLVQKTCDGVELTAPSHWYLKSSHLCDGKQALGLINTDGMDNSEHRKELWYQLLYTMGAMFVDEELRSFGGETEDMANKIKLGLTLLSTLAPVVDRGGITKGAYAEVRGGTVYLKISDTIGKGARNFLVLTRQHGGYNATYANALIRVAKAVDAADLTNTVIEIGENNFYEIYSIALLEAVIEDWVSYLQDTIGCEDPVLCEILAEFEDPENSVLIKMFEDMRTQNQVDILKSAISLSSFMGQALSKMPKNVGQAFGAAGKILGVLGALWFAYDTLNYTFGEYPRAYEISSLGFSLARRLQQRNDAYGMSILLLAMLASEKYLTSYFEPELFNITVNAESLLIEDVQDNWYDVLFNDEYNISQISDLAEECIIHEELEPSLRQVRVNIESNYLNLRKSSSTRSEVIGIFYAEDKCVLAYNDYEQYQGRNWVKVYHPYMGKTGWVDSQYLAESSEDCSFEYFLYENRSEKNWFLDFMADEITLYCWELEGDASSSDELGNTLKNLLKISYFTEYKLKYDKIDIVSLLSKPYTVVQPLGLLTDTGVDKEWDNREDNCVGIGCDDKMNFNYFTLKDKNLFVLAFVKYGNELILYFVFEKKENSFNLISQVIFAAGMSCNQYY